MPTNFIIPLVHLLATEIFKIVAAVFLLQIIRLMGDKQAPDMGAHGVGNAASTQGARLRLKWDIQEDKITTHIQRDGFITGYEVSPFLLVYADRIFVI